MARGLGPVATLVFAAVLLLALAVTPACSSSDKKDGGDEVERANFLIDQKQYSEAIYILNEHVKKEPRDTHAKILLGSAYAARAGVSLSSYSSFGNELEKWGKIDDILSAENDSSLLQTVAKAAVRVQIIMDAFDSLPSAQGPSERADLASALSALDEAGQLEGGPALYRALIRVAVFKQDLSTVYRPNFIQGCRISTHDLTIWVQTVAGEAGKIILDVSNGVHDAGAKARTEEFGRKLHEAVSDVTSASQIGDVAVEIPEPLRKVYGACE